MNHISWTITGRLFNTLRPRQNGRHFADEIFKRIFLNENVEISIKISLKFVPKGRINNIPTLVQVMAWRRPGDKPLTEPMVVRLLTNICVTRPQWVTSWMSAINHRTMLDWLQYLAFMRHTKGLLWHDHLYNIQYRQTSNIRCTSVGN